VTKHFDKLEVDLIKMIKCYEKSYARYFTDSENKWREIDKLKKERK
jgi:hypothetical protein